MRPHKRDNGSCPYCQGSQMTNFTFVKNVKDGQVIEIHQTCDKYSHLNVNTGIRYPLQNPSDQNSTAYI